MEATLSLFMPFIPLLGSPLDCPTLLRRILAKEGTHEGDIASNEIEFSFDDVPEGDGNSGLL